VIVHLTTGDVSVVLDAAHPGAPTIVHWGAAIDTVEGISGLTDRPVPNAVLDVPAPPSLVPEHGSGYLGLPGIEGHRPDGSGWAPRFGTPAVRQLNDHAVEFTSTDPHAALQLAVTVKLDAASTLLIVQATLTNTSTTTSYDLDAFRLHLPVPGYVRETLTFAGRWANEFQPVRTAWPSGMHAVEGRSGRTSHDRIPVAFAGTPAFSEQHGDVYGVHVGWSGNAAIAFDAPSDGRRSIAAGELLLSGEISLAPGESYPTPTVYGAYSPAGVTPASQAFHRFLRSRPGHPIIPRPVTLNTWEAVYFDHNLDVLKQLATTAAAVGIERFVLDDGWFNLRRNDRAGLGDWWVDPAVWPNGLSPIIDHVRALGMEFGLWFEPEMVNPDSDLFRAHPEWVLHDADYEPVLGRHQLVLNVANPAVADYLFTKIDAVLTEYPIAYVKWDMNRDLVHASSNHRAAVHIQTLAVYALFDRVRAAHPNVEIETCSSGGARIDFEILARTDRVWTSDCNDALDRQNIQRGFSHFVPPELMGAHVGPPISHTTGRKSHLSFRGLTALFGHFGVEWNILDATDEQRDRLAAIIALHKQHRPLLHTGDVMRFDTANPALLAHGVYAADRSDALVSFVLIATARSHMLERVLLPGLDPSRRYQVRLIPMPGASLGPGRVQPDWITNGLVATGRQLAILGLQPPVLHPESGILIHLTAL
jgi:alpha-galactosidase